jgi:hypothetical protein
MALPLAVSTLGIVLIAVGVIVLLVFVLGLLGARARDRRVAPHWEEHVTAADQALEEARAADRGWHRDNMEQAAREALQESRPGWRYRDLHLVLVDDRPGAEEDRAQFVAMGEDGEVRVVLGRHDDRWVAEQVE